MINETLNLGIDFGTSNSAVGYTEGPEVNVVPVQRNLQTQPSYVYIDASGYSSTGFEALNDYLKASKISHHFVPSIKQGLPESSYEGNTLTSTEIDNGRYKKKFFSVEALASLILSDLKKRAEDLTGRTSSNVVLGRPVFFSEDPTLDLLAQNRLEEAAHLAGFQNIHFLAEPLAATLQYARNRTTEKSENVLVFDFGGGTLDISAVALSSGKEFKPYKDSQNVLASYGIDLGGTDLDKDIFKDTLYTYFDQSIHYGPKKLPVPAYLFTNLAEWHLSQAINSYKTTDMLLGIISQLPPEEQKTIRRLNTLIREQQVFSILSKIEKAKIMLSMKDPASIEYFYQSAFANIEINLGISRSEFERIIRERIEQIRLCISETLLRAQLKPSDVDLVLKVGGSSKNLFVDNLLRDIFLRVEETDTFTSVVAGLSIASGEIYN